MDPSGLVTCRVRSGNALTWAENRKKQKERMTRNEVWVGRKDCMVNFRAIYLTKSGPAERNDPAFEVCSENEEKERRGEGRR